MKKQCVRQSFFALCLLLSVFCVPFRVTADDGLCRFVPNDKNYIALTFDDGPHPIYTERILDVLAEYGVRATFFQIGENLVYYGATGARVADAGHEIGNHTYTHRNLQKLKDPSIVEEILLCERAIKETTGVMPRLFRPPEGTKETRLCDILERLGYAPIYWSIDTYDWKGKSAEEIANGVIKKVKSGDIILMHDFTSLKSQADKALRIMIPALLKQGYQFVTVSELLSLREDVNPKQPLPSPSSADRS